MGNKNTGFRIERFGGGIRFERDNIRIELTPFNDYYLTRNSQSKNEGYKLIKL